jgi:hypothetical protein
MQHRFNELRKFLNLRAKKQIVNHLAPIAVKILEEIETKAGIWTADKARAICSKTKNEFIR